MNITMLAGRTVLTGWMRQCNRRPRGFHSTIGKLPTFKYTLSLLSSPQKKQGADSASIPKLKIGGKPFSFSGNNLPIVKPTSAKLKRLFLKYRFQMRLGFQ
jgi:hypothetical protein